MIMMERNNILREIEANVAKYGHHNYLVIGGASPRYAYTIGLSETVGYELVFAGSAYYFTDEASQIINAVAGSLRSVKNWKSASIELPELGSFSIREAHTSWVKAMLHGALDYYNVTDLLVLQTTPDQEHWTAEVPNLTEPWSPVAEPAWRWLNEEWEYPVPKRSTAVTNLNALRGRTVTEAVRWEEDSWELFAGAGPDVPKKDIREVSLGTLLGIDPSLCAVTKLDVGQGLWRDPDDREWHPWGTGNN